MAVRARCGEAQRDGLETGPDRNKGRASPHAGQPEGRVSRPCYYDPDLIPTYQELALHCGTTVLPAPPREPRDKAKVEAGVQAVERWTAFCSM